ncbi:MAG: DUF2252 family protein, partial [Acidimicrobiales bacterium]
ARDFYFRQLWDGKASADIGDMGGKRLRLYAAFCGGSLALAHARSGDPALIAGYVGEDETLDYAIESFSAGYTDRNDGDHEAHLAAIESGQLPATRDI